MIAPFRNHLPVKIRFGDGVAGQLGRCWTRRARERPFLIMDRGLDEFRARRGGGDRAARPAPCGSRRTPASRPWRWSSRRRRRWRRRAATPWWRWAAAPRWTPPRRRGWWRGRAAPTCGSPRGGVAYEPPAIPLVCVPDHGRHRVGGIGRRRHHRPGDPRQGGHRQPAAARPARAGGRDADPRAAGQADRLHRHRRARPGDGGAGGDGAHAGRRRDRAGGHAAGRRCAGAGRPRRIRRRRSQRDDVREPAGRAGHEHLGLRLGALDRTGHRRAAGAAARAHDRPGAGRDDGPRPPVRARSSSSGSPTRWASPTTAPATDRGRCGRCAGSWPSSSSRRWRSVGVARGPPRRAGRRTRWPTTSSRWRRRRGRTTRWWRRCGRGWRWATAASALIGALGCRWSSLSRFRSSFWVATITAGVARIDQNTP